MIEVRVDHFDTAEGLLILSLKGAAVEANWENLRKGLIVEARVTKANKGGVEVEVDGQTHDVHTYAGTVGEVLQAEGINVNVHDSLSPSPSAQIGDGGTNMIKL